jgi:hypothetical protein
LNALPGRKLHANLTNARQAAGWQRNALASGFRESSRRPFANK